MSKTKTKPTPAVPELSIKEKLALSLIAHRVRTSTELGSELYGEGDGGKPVRNRQAYARPGAKMGHRLANLGLVIQGQGNDGRFVWKITEHGLATGRKLSLG